MLQDRGAGETQQERGRETALRCAREPVTREHALDRLPDAMAALARRALVALLVPLHEGEEVGAPPEEAEDAEHDLLEHGVGRCVGVGRTLDLRREALEARFERTPVEVVLGRKIEIDRALADARARGHLADVHLMEIPLREHGRGRGENPITFDLLSSCVRHRELTGQFSLADRRE